MGSFTFENSSGDFSLPQSVFENKTIQAFVNIDDVLLCHGFGRFTHSCNAFGDVCIIKNLGLNEISSNINYVCVIVQNYILFFLFLFI